MLVGFTAKNCKHTRRCDAVPASNGRFAFAVSASPANIPHIVRRQLCFLPAVSNAVDVVVSRRTPVKVLWTVVRRIIVAMAALCAVWTGAIESHANQRVHKIAGSVSVFGKNDVMVSYFSFSNTWTKNPRLATLWSSAYSPYSAKARRFVQSNVSRYGLPYLIHPIIVTDGLQKINRG